MTEYLQTIYRSFTSPDAVWIQRSLMLTLNAGANTITFTGGAGLFPRLVLEKVGTFNPYLLSDEEPELCLRIRHAGYKLYKINIPIVYHYTEPHFKLSTLAGRWKRRLYIGAGQTIRYNLGKPLFWHYVFERGYCIFPATGLALGLVTLILSALTRQWLWFGVWLFLLIGYIGADALRKHSFYLTFYSLSQRFFYLRGVMRGFFIQPHPPAGYPARVKVLKTLDLENKP